MEQQSDQIAGLIIIAIFVTLIWLFYRAKKANAISVTQSLVLKTFNIFSNGKSGTYIEITGRPPGLISLLLTTLKLEDTTTFTLLSDRVVYSGASLMGEHNVVFPLPSIESTACGYTKPISWLFLGLAFFIAGVTIMIQGLNLPDGQSDTVFFITAFIFGATSIVTYFLSKKTYISVSVGSVSLYISFKKSIIEGAPITLDKTIEAIVVLNQRIADSQMK